MVPKAGLVVLDSNLFIIDLRYPRDRHYRLNRAFLTRLPTLAPAATTLINPLEVCGILLRVPREDAASGGRPGGIRHRLHYCVALVPIQ